MSYHRPSIHSGTVRLLVQSTVAVSLAAVIGGCSDSAGDSALDDDSGSTPESIAWQPCLDKPMLDCASMSVPLVHDAPDGRTIAVDLVRLPSTGETEGEPLLLNPGGPGGSGTESVRTFLELDNIPAEIRARFDVIGFDPRGIGASERIDCEQFGIDDLDDYPRDADDLSELIEDSLAVVDACTSEYGDRLSWLGSNSVVEDMEMLRQALGAERLNFIGYSYGSRLAALYLQRYPEQSGRIVLDGSTLPTGETEVMALGQASGFQRNLEQLFDQCGTLLPDCQRDALPSAFKNRLLSLIDGEDEMSLDIFTMLLTEAVQDPRVAELVGPVLIRFALDGESAPLLDLMDQYESINDDDDPVVFDSDTVQHAVICADDPVRPTFDSLVATMAELDARSDLFGEALVPLVASCVGWPEALDPVYPMLTTDAPTSLVIGGSSDISTLAEWTPLMAEAIGGFALLSDHAGHTAVFSDKSACVDDAVIAFLLDGTLPDDQQCRVVSGVDGE